MPDASWRAREPGARASLEGVSVVVAVLLLVLVAGVVLLVTAPLRRGRAAAEPCAAGAPDAADAPPGLADLEAAREAKYREIRDAELDYRTGKLSDEDYRAIDAELRAEAIAILDRLERERARLELPSELQDAREERAEGQDGRADA
jgi:hypothetical protein